MLEGGLFSVCEFLQINMKDYVATRLYPQTLDEGVTCQAATRLLHAPTSPVTK